MSTQAHLPTTNVIQRTRLVRFNAMPLIDNRNRQRTGILIDRNEQQFLVTSKNLFQSFDSPDLLCEPPLQLDMHVDGQWQSITIEEYGSTPFDLAVLRLATPIPSLPISMGFRDVTLGQEVFFLGFPNGHPDIGPPLESDAVPLIGRGTLSNLGEQSSFFLMQCNAFRGFAGGPVVSMSNQDLPHVIGIVCDYDRWSDKPEDDIGLEVPTGFVMCLKMNVALVAADHTRSVVWIDE